MSHLIIDGKEAASKIQNKLLTLVSEIRETSELIPTLAIIQVGNDPSSTVYIKNKLQALKKVGMQGQHIHLSESIVQEELEKTVENLNKKSSIHGIIIQLPLPKKLNKERILNILDPEKDVDGLTFYNQGLLFNNIYNSFLPCTPLGCLYLLKKLNTSLSGKLAVIVGRSNLVGKPLANLLLHQGCTVIQTHRETKNLPELTTQADILAVAIGSPNFITNDMVKQGVQVLDIGINRLCSGELTGDVNTSNVKSKVSAITPVPGGIGPMTVSMLLLNTLQAAYNSLNVDISLYKKLLKLD